MPRLAIGTGIILALIGVGGYLQTEGASLTALAPAVVGVLFIGLGAAALNKAWRKHAMHVASLVALLGIIGSARGLADLPRYLTGESDRGLATLAEASTALVLLVFMIFAVKSFIDARRKREEAA